VPEDVTFPPNSVIMGIPATRTKDAEDHHRLRVDLSWRMYAELAAATLPAVADMPGNPSKRVRIELADAFERL